MGGNGWMIGVALAMIPVGLIWWEKRHPPKFRDGWVACTKCGHAEGLAADGKHCANVEPVTGWANDACVCQNDFHWNYESTEV